MSDEELLENEKLFQKAQGRKRLIKSKYGKLYDECVELLFRYDPMKLTGGDHREAYVPEVLDLLPRLNEATSETKLQSILYEIFIDQFSIMTRPSPKHNLSEHSRQKLDAAAQEIWLLWKVWRASVLDHSDEAFKAIADEIIAMSEVDQQMRKSGQWDQSIDIANTQRMKGIVEQVGWPTISKVGRQASMMAWLLVQHADHDRVFQQSCLNLMKAQPEGEVSPANIAYLDDRIRVAEGRPQLYGTQFYIDDSGKFGPRPIEDPAYVDERRKAVGLNSLAKYTCDMYSYNQKSEN